MLCGSDFHPLEGPSGQWYRSPNHGLHMKRIGSLIIRTLYSQFLIAHLKKDESYKYAQWKSKDPHKLFMVSLQQLIIFVQIIKSIRRSLDPSIRIHIKHIKRYKISIKSYFWGHVMNSSWHLLQHQSIKIIAVYLPKCHTNPTTIIHAVHLQLSPTIKAT